MAAAASNSTSSTNGNRPATVHCRHAMHTTCTCTACAIAANHSRCRQASWPTYTQPTALWRMQACILHQVVALVAAAASAHRPPSSSSNCGWCAFSGCSEYASATLLLQCESAATVFQLPAQLLVQFVVSWCLPIWPLPPECIPLVARCSAIHCCSKRFLQQLHLNP